MQQPTTRERPLGITILAVLAAIAGVLGLLGSLALLGISGAVGVGGGVLWAIVSLALAVAYLAFAYGAWSLKPWAWTLGVGIAAVGILWALYLFTQPGGSIVSLIISLAISGVILYYLFQPDVKAAFGRS
jgi:hypothetical protein